MTRLLATLLILTMFTGSAAAQDRPPEAGWERVAAALGPGTLVNVRMRDRTRMTGVLIRHTGEGITIQPRTRIPVAPRELTYSEIESLVRARKPGLSPGVKVVLGAGVGAAVVILATGLALAAMSD